MHRAILCVAATLLAACRDDPVDREPPLSTVVVANATAIRVVDGDTIVVRVGGVEEHVRLIGIDTPETVKPAPGGGTEPAECFGHEASTRTATLLPSGTPLRLERDVEARDDYGRLLAYVYRATDGLFVNLDLVDAGYATPLRFPPNVVHAAEIAVAASAASDAGRGLWTACAAPVASRG